jgi:hypothetical protein
VAVPSAQLVFSPRCRYLNGVSMSSPQYRSWCKSFRTHTKLRRAFIFYWDLSTEPVIWEGAWSCETPQLRNKELWTLFSLLACIG